MTMMMALVASSYQGTDGLPFAIVGIVLGPDRKPTSQTGDYFGVKMPKEDEAAQWCGIRRSYRYYGAYLL